MFNNGVKKCGAKTSSARRFFIFFYILHFVRMYAHAVWQSLCLICPLLKITALLIFTENCTPLHFNLYREYDHDVHKLVRLFC